MNDKLEDIKSLWQSIAIDDNALEDANRTLSIRFSAKKVASLQSKLARRTRIVSWAGLLLPVLAPMLHYVAGISPGLSIAYAVFGIAMSVFGLVLASHMQSRQLVEMPVADALMHAASIRKWMVTERIVGIVCGVAILAWLFVEIFSFNDLPMLFGAIAGLGFGLAAGISRSLKDFRMIRHITDCLSN